MRRVRMSRAWTALLVVVGLWTALVSASELQAEAATLAGTVTNAEDGTAVAGATILVVEVQREARANGTGGYRVSVPPGSYLVLATAPGFELQEKRVTVEAGDATTVDFALQPALASFGEELIVVGSRAARTTLETPVPVDVLSSEDLSAGGLTETSRQIQFLAPSFNHSTSTISDGTDIVRPSTLRGLGPDQTLVLINGKRRHTSALVHVNGSVGRGTAGVDLNAIPASAIERVEILRDGAAAQYGSDAIAGVINIVLKGATEKTRVGVSLGEQFEGDGEVVQVSANKGWTIGDRGYFNLTAEYRDRGLTNRAGPDPRQQYNLLPDGSPDPREATFDRLNHRYGDAESENLYLFANSLVPINDSTDAYFFGGISQREGESGGFYRRALDARTVPEIHPDGFLPLINTEVDDASLSVGLRKIFRRWSVDASLTHGDNSFAFDITNSNNVSLGVGSPTEAEAGTLNFQQTSFNVDVFGTVDWGLRSPVNVAFGVEWRRDNYEIEAGEEASWIDGGVPDQYGGVAAPGIQVFPGFRPSNEVDESRDNVGIYGDLEFNLSDRTLVAIAARYEDYDDFGDNVSGKVAVRQELSDDFALRGSLSTGFRAPSLHQAYFNNTSTQFVFDETSGELVPFEVGTFRNDSAVAQGFGVPALKEETSTNYSAGFTWRPSRNVSVTADFFRIEIDDRIVVSGQFRAEAGGGPIQDVLGPLGVSAAQFFTNAVDTETEGVDLVISWARAVGPRATLSLTGAANWNQTEVVGTVRTPPVLAGLGERLFDRIERERMESAQPRELYNLTAKLSVDRFSALLRFNKFGAVKTVEVASDPSRDMVSTGKWLTDFDLSYDLGNGLGLSVGANNVFDVYPDENRDDLSFNGIFVYPRRTAPFGFNGGHYYTRLTYEF